MDRTHVELEAEMELEDEHGTLGQHNRDGERTTGSFRERTDTPNHSQDWGRVRGASQQRDCIQHHATRPSAISIQVEQLPTANTESIDATPGHEVLEDDERKHSVEAHE